MDESVRPIVRALRRYMHRKGLSVTDLAKMCGVERSRLSRFLNMRAELSGPQWRRLWVAIGAHAEIMAAVVRVVEGL